MLLLLDNSYGNIEPRLWGLHVIGKERYWTRCSKTSLRALLQWTAAMAPYTVHDPVYIATLVVHCYG